MKLKIDEKGNVVVVEGKPVYTHEDGKDIPFDAAQTLQTISRLNGEAKGHRERAEGLDQSLKAFEGLDAAIARKAIETVKKIDDKLLVDAGKVDEVKAAAIKATQEGFAAEKKSILDEAERLKTENAKLANQYASELIGGSFTRSKFITEKFAVPADMAQARFGNNFRIEDGKVVAYDSAGKQIFSRARPGEVADFDEALGILVDAYPHKDSILKGAVQAGGGAVNGGGGGGGKKTIKRAAFDALPAAEKQALMKPGAGVSVVD